MRKIVMLNRISLDGFFAGLNGEIDWFIHDPEVDQAAHEMMQPDTLLLGRVTYQMFESYWPPIAMDPDAPEEARIIANELNQMNKVVFSKTLEEVTWVNTKLVHDGIVGEVEMLKQGAGPDITIFGSGSIVQQLTNRGLIDEYLIIVTPVVVGTGKPLFKDVQNINLKLLDTRNFKSGNVLLHYAT
ncbi:MAG: deaminase [Chloroflexi bacterium RBG_16_57_11]|nr:MAG: deaminase [Chloroflexi bacterium RBG_16_57_11]